MIRCAKGYVVQSDLRACCSVAQFWEGGLTSSALELGSPRLTFIPVLYVPGIKRGWDRAQVCCSCLSELEVIYGMLLWAFTDWCLTSRILILHLGKVYRAVVPRGAAEAKVEPPFVCVLGHEGLYPEVGVSHNI